MKLLSNLTKGIQVTARRKPLKRSERNHGICSFLIIILLCIGQLISVFADDTDFIIIPEPENTDFAVIDDFSFNTFSESPELDDDMIRWILNNCINEVNNDIKNSFINNFVSAAVAAGLNETGISNELQWLEEAVSNNLEVDETLSFETILYVYEHNLSSEDKQALHSLYNQASTFSISTFAETTGDGGSTSGGGIGRNDSLFVPFSAALLSREGGGGSTRGGGIGKRDWFWYDESTGVTSTSSGSGSSMYFTYNQFANLLTNGYYPYSHYNSALADYVKNNLATSFSKSYKAMYFYEYYSPKTSTGLSSNCDGGHNMYFGYSNNTNIYPISYNPAKSIYYYNGFYGGYPSSTVFNFRTNGTVDGVTTALTWSGISPNYYLSRSDTSSLTAHSSRSTRIVFYPNDSAIPGVINDSIRGVDTYYDPDTLYPNYTPVDYTNPTNPNNPGGSGNTGVPDDSSGNTLFDWIFKGISGLFEFLLSGITGLFNSLLNLLSSIFDIVKGIPGMIVEGIGGIITWLLDSILNFFKFLPDVLNSILNFLMSLPVTIVDGIGAFFTSLYNFLSGLFSSLTGLLVDILDFLKSIVVSIINGFKDLLIYLFVPSDDFWESQFDKLKNVLESKLPYEKYVSVISSLGNTGAAMRSNGGGFQDFNITFMGVNVTLPWTKYLNDFIPTLQSWIRGFFYLLLACYNYRQIMYLIRGHTYSPIGNSHTSGKKGG